MNIELWQFIASMLSAWGVLAGTFGVGFTVGRSRGKTEAYADAAAKRKKGRKNRPASTHRHEQGEGGTTTPPYAQRGTQGYVCSRSNGCDPNWIESDSGGGD